MYKLFWGRAYKISQTDYKTAGKLIEEKLQLYKIMQETQL